MFSIMNILMEARNNAGKYYISPSSPSVSQGTKTASVIMGTLVTDLFFCHSVLLGTSSSGFIYIYSVIMELIMCNIFIWIQFFIEGRGAKCPTKIKSLQRKTPNIIFLLKLKHHKKIIQTCITHIGHLNYML